MAIIISLLGVAPPPRTPPHQHLRCARRPVSSANLASARTTAQNATPPELQGSKVEAVPEPAQFKLRTPQAISRVPRSAIGIPPSTN
eukprot:11869536-Alexandrium_andersonii.AAC.1